MKLLDLNTHSWIEVEQERKLGELIDFILAGDYDLITLQEVNQTMTAPLWEPDAYFCPVAKQRSIKEDNFARLLVEGLRQAGKAYYWAWADAHIGFDRYDEGVAILSKEPMQPEAYWVSAIQDRTDYHTRVLLRAQTHIGERALQVASGHFSWWDPDSDISFGYEWKKTETILRGHAELPLILMGDFNNPADKRQQGYDLIAASDLKLQDAFLVAKEKEGEFTVEKAIDGWEGNVDQLRIDLAFLSQDFVIDSYSVVLDGQRGPHVNEHFDLASIAHRA